MPVLLRCLQVVDQASHACLGPGHVAAHAVHEACSTRNLSPPLTAA